MFRFTYPAKLTADRKDGGYVVTFRDLPEAITQGESIEEALSEAEGALQAAIEGRIEDDMEVPAPSQPKRGERPVATPVTTALKAAVYSLNPRQQKALAAIRAERRLTNARYQALTGASRPTSKRDLEELVSKGVLSATGAGRGAAYVVAIKWLRNGSNGSATD